MTQALISPPFLSTMDNPVTGGKINFYEVKISALAQQVYPGKSKAKLVGYDGMSPGPTFYMEKGTEAVVRFINESPTDSSIHLHGSYSVREFAPLIKSAAKFQTLTLPLPHRELLGMAGQKMSSHLTSGRTTTIPTTSPHAHCGTTTTPSIT